MSFVSPDFKQVIHTFCNIARTDVLYHTLNPSEKTIERRLQAIWARTWNETFSDVDTAIAFVSSKLQDIHITVSTHYSKDLKSVDTLDKIKTLARSSFNRAGRSAEEICKKPLSTHANEVKENLRAVWKDAQKKLKHVAFEMAKPAIEAALNAAVVPQNIKDLYLEDIHLAQTIEGLESRLQSYMNDLEVKGAGITSTSLGSQGFPKIIDVQRDQRILGFMKTLGNSLEMDYHLLYSFFLGDCLGREDLHIQVPSASMFDVEKAKYVDSRGNKYDISKYNEQIKHLLGSVASLNTDASKVSADKEIEFQNIIQTCPTGFFELVNGLNLADFFRAKYLSLDAPQKDRFWSSLGVITYLDLILGNRDRLIKLLPNIDGQYSFLSDNDENFMEDSNLGNLMISHALTDFYAIDNGIGDGTRNLSISKEENLADEQAYTTFLHNALGKEDFETLACDYLIKSLGKAIESAFQEADYDENSLGAVLFDISKEDHISSLNGGMKRMQDLLSTIILPKWNHTDADSVRKTLDADFIGTIQTRLDLFARLKCKSTPPQIESESDEDMLVELDLNSSSGDWSSPVRGSSFDVRSTPFSPLMSRSRNKALGNIADHLKELSIAIASEDVRNRILAELESLKINFLLPPDIQQKIVGIEDLLSSTGPNKDYPKTRINELANSLLSMDPSLISPRRVSRQQSWDEADPFSGNSSLSLFLDPKT